MLEFIVLGQIPGTHIQVTIAWFAFALLGLLIWADVRFHTHRATKTKKSTRHQRQARA